MGVCGEAASLASGHRCSARLQRDDLRGALGVFLLMPELRRDYDSGLSLRLTGVTLESLEPPLIGRIVFARLDLGGQHRTRLPIDEGMDRGPLHLELHFAQGAELRLRARSLQVRVEPGSRFTESMAC